MLYKTVYNILALLDLSDINNRVSDLTEEQSVCIMLNGEESELKFINITNERVRFKKSVH